MNKSIHLHIFRKILIGFKSLGIGCMLLFCFGLYAQKQSKPLIPRLAYSKWHQVSAEAIYNKESWVVYKTYYNTGTDTLFIEHTNKHKRFTLANTSFKGFIDEKSILIDCEKSNIVLEKLFFDSDVLFLEFLPIETKEAPVISQRILCLTS